MISSIRTIPLPMNNAALSLLLAAEHSLCSSINPSKEYQVFQKTMTLQAHVIPKESRPMLIDTSMQSADYLANKSLYLLTQKVISQAIASHETSSAFSIEVQHTIHLTTQTKEPGSPPQSFSPSYQKASEFSIQFALTRKNVEGSTLLLFDPYYFSPLFSAVLQPMQGIIWPSSYLQHDYTPLYASDPSCLGLASFLSFYIKK